MNVKLNELRDENNTRIQTIFKRIIIGNFFNNFIHTIIMKISIKISGQKSGVETATIFDTEKVTKEFIAFWIRNVVSEFIENTGVQIIINTFE